MPAGGREADASRAAAGSNAADSVFRVCGLWFVVCGLWFRVQELGFRLRV